MDGTIVAKIRIGIVGVGNCASSLVQGLGVLRGQESRRRDRSDALGSSEATAPATSKWRPRSTSTCARSARTSPRPSSRSPTAPQVFCDDLPKTGVLRADGSGARRPRCPTLKILSRTTVASSRPTRTRRTVADEIVEALCDARVDVLVNYLPVGSEEAARFYAECALEAGAALVNCIPVFIASDPAFAARFEAAGLPIVGDDIKAQLGATITHRMLTDLFAKRGVKVERTYQLNTGGNTDFLNMLNRDRLASKKESKTEAVQSVAADAHRGREHPRGSVGLRALGRTTTRSASSGWKGSSSATCRCTSSCGSPSRTRRTRPACPSMPSAAPSWRSTEGMAGIVEGPSAFFMKHPPAAAHRRRGATSATERFIRGE